MARQAAEDARAELAYVRAQLRIAEKALEPFAGFADHFPTTKRYGNRPTSGEFYQVSSHGKHDASLTVEAVHAARAALSAIREGRE